MTDASLVDAELDSFLKQVHDSDVGISKLVQSLNDERGKVTLLRDEIASLKATAEDLRCQVRDLKQEKSRNAARRRDDDNEVESIKMHQSMIQKICK